MTETTETRTEVDLRFRERLAALEHEYANLDDPRNWDFDPARRDEKAARLSALLVEWDAAKAEATPDIISTPDDPKANLLDLARRCRLTGDTAVEAKALSELSKIDRAEKREQTGKALVPSTAGAQPPVSIQVKELIINVIEHGRAAGQPPLWADVEAAIVAQLPLSTKRQRKQLLRELGFTLRQFWGSDAGALRIVPLALPEQDGEGHPVE